ncbi:MAG: response regulator [Marivibrio sp.]|uniref:response regulator n=1 Tax=Marivibrio sp. TaxID=2039719 RepID=UPI0032EEFCB0
MTQFDNATVLVVEDNALVRRLLTAVLRAIGVGRVVAAANGQEAIRVMRAVSARAAAQDADGERGDGAEDGADDAAPDRIDAVLSDWVMHPGDGTALLRWIRRHDDSPNRFVPFLMLSAYADPARVRKARDLGVTAFIAKPFTADTVARYLSTALSDARRFVEVGEYFGPDRRKRAAELSEQERRDLDHSDREKGVRFFVPPQLHEGRVVPGGGVDAKRLMAIQKVIEQRGETFLDWTRETLARLDLERESAAKRAVGDRRTQFSRINMIAHELRGMGTTFGYPLISAVAKGLFDLTAHSWDRSDAALKAVRSHSTAMKRILREDMRGDGADAGRALLEALAAERRALEPDPSAPADGASGSNSAPNRNETA